MKTLSEQVNEIKSNSDSLKKKQEALFKLGLTKYEVKLILDAPATARRETHKFTFGVEIECLMPRPAFIVAARHTGLQYQYESYNHTDNKTYYKFVSDSSIHGANPIECVSPVLSGKSGLESLKKCCNTINAAGARVNVSTGLHVHIGAESLTDEQYVSVFVNYKMLETVIDTFMAASRRGNGCEWCKTLINSNFSWCHTKSDVREVLHDSRYFKVNPCSYARHRTIEFRQHQGSTDFKKISAWVNFCAKLVAWSKKHRLATPVASINDIPFLTAREKAYLNRRAAELA